MLMPTKSSGEAIVFESSSVNFGASPAGVGEVGVGVRAFEDHGQELRVQLAGGDLGRLDVLRRLDDRYRDA